MIEVSFAVGLLIGGLIGNMNVNNKLHRQGYQAAVAEECRQISDDLGESPGRELKEYLTTVAIESGCEKFSNETK